MVADFWTRVDVSGDCWEWQGYVTAKGYGEVSHQKVHRIAYEQRVGPIPQGMVLDHLCRNRRCVNPSHLEPVTSGENVLRGEGVAAVNARKERCVRGHENWSLRSGHRLCVTCKHEYAVRRYRNRTLGSSAVSSDPPTEATAEQPRGRFHRPGGDGP